METRIIDITVQGQEIFCTEKMPYPRTNTVRYLHVHFDADAIWHPLKKIAVFRRSGTPTLTVPLDESMMCELPPQMLAIPAGSGMVTVHVGMIGIGAGDYRLTTGEAQVRIDPSCYAKGQTPGDPPQDIYEELLKRVEDAEKIDPEEIRAAIDDYLRENPIDVQIMTEDTAGIAKVGDNLKIDAAGRLSVDTADEVEGDNTRPVTAGAVYDRINKVPTVPLKIRILCTETSCIQNIIGHKYTAADLYELAQTRDIVLESYGTANYRTLYGYYRYARGSETAVVFDGWYENPNGRIVPARATIDANGSVSIARKTFAEGTVKTDTSLTISGSAADARAVGGEIESLKEIYSRVVTPGVENTGKLLYVDESGNGSFLQLGDGLEIVNGRLCIIGTVTPDEPVEPDSEYTYLLDSTRQYLKTADDLYVVCENI